MSTKTNKINFAGIVAAAGAGAAYEMGYQSLARNVEVLQENYLVGKAAIAGALGTGVLYFGSGAKKETEKELAKAIGYGLLGVAGQGAGAKISQMMSEGDDDTEATADDTGVVNAVQRMKPQARRDMLKAMCERIAGNTKLQRAREPRTIAPAGAQMAVVERQMPKQAQNWTWGSGW